MAPRWAAARLSRSSRRGAVGAARLAAAAAALLVAAGWGPAGVEAAVSRALPSLYVKANASKAAPFGLRRGGGCQVLYLDASEDALLPSGQLLDLGAFDGVLTNAHDLVPWAASRDDFHFIDDSVYPHQPGRDRYERKRFQRTLSVLVPRQPQSPEVARWTEEALQAMPDDVFVDDGTPTSRRPAFEGYAFSLLLSVDDRVPPAALLESVAFSAVPMLVFDVPHFLNYTVYFPYMVGKFRPDGFSPTHVRSFVTKSPADTIYVMQNSLMLVQDFFYCRYCLPFAERLALYTERLCEIEAVPPGLRTDVFVAIYSAKENFPARRAARETWLTLLDGLARRRAEPIIVAYKFLLNAVGAGDPADPASSVVDDALRAEGEVFGDLVFLEALQEYPIGNMGRLALRWIANHTAATYILKFDDDMYIRPLPLLRYLVRQQRAMMYWGFFERSGLVVRDPDSAHFLPPDLFGHDGVFPPYARGAALALSLDLVRLIAILDRLGHLRRLKVEDASYGYFLYQLMTLGLTTVTLADREEEHFALDPKCCTEQSHPNNCWSPLKDATWIVHHVGPQAIRCMFRVDIESGYYRTRQGQSQSERRCLAAATLSAMVPGDDAADVASAPCGADWAAEAVEDQAAYDPTRRVLPSLCGCVRTPPAHPGQPKPGPMAEGPGGPRLYDT